MKLEKIIQRSTKNYKDKIKMDKTQQKLTKQDDNFKEGKLKIDNNQLKLEIYQHKAIQNIVVNLLKSFKIDKEQIRINTTKTDKNRQKTTKIVQNLSQHFLKSAKPTKIDNNFAAN